MTLHQFSSAGSLAEISAGDRVVVGGQEARHALGAHRLADGSRFLLSDGEGTVATAVVSTDSDRGKSAVLVGEVVSVQTTDRPQPILHLVQALAKGDRDLAGVEMATELGVASVTPWEAERSIVKWPAARADKAAGKWSSLLAAASKQSRNPWTPQLEEAVTSRRLADRVKESTEAGARVLILHEEATVSLLDWAEDIRRSEDMPEVTIVVGPEGGISPRECELFTEAGAELVGLGSLILRASSAGPVAMVTLQSLLVQPGSAPLGQS